MTTAVFVYGSLMAPEVLRIVINRDELPQSNPAVLPGYARHPIAHRVYPAIVPNAGHSVDGLLLCDLTPSDLHVLCMFEAPEYELRDVQVQDSTGTAHNSSAYVWREEHRCAHWVAPGVVASLTTVVYRHMLEDQGAWSYAAFREQHLPDYVEMCQRWAASIATRAPPCTHLQ